MDNNKESSSSYLSFTVVVGLLIVVCTVTLKYILKVLRGLNDEEPQNAPDVKSESSGDHRTAKASQAPKKKKKQNWSSQNDNKSFSHMWLLTSLKGHSGQILDMDLSSNGKYLVSCADEDPDPGGQPMADHLLSKATAEHPQCLEESSSNSSSSSSSADPSPRSSNSNSCKNLSRRQRKNRFRREDNSPPELHITTTLAIQPPITKKRAKGDNFQPLRHFTKLNLTERVLGTYLRSYLLSPEQMLALGYPIESCEHPGRAVIFKSDIMPRRQQQQQQQQVFDITRSRFDVNAREFIPRKYEEDSSSGHGSGNTSDSEDSYNDYNSSASYLNSCVGVEHKCVRCQRNFLLTEKEYLTQERCCYHWGKLVRQEKSLYACCKGRENSKGCITNRVHVWSGLSSGFNGPFEQYVRTKPRKTAPSDGNFGIYALDCEMCYTISGLELAKITVLGPDGRLVYDSFVLPDNEIVDYNTRFSGITARDFTSSGKRGTTKTLREVQNDLMGFINADTVLVGHGLENDLRALRIMHGTVVDTAVSFPHYNGLPYRRSLKSLTIAILRREIQSNGHNAHEDAKAALELMLWRVKKDFGSILGCQEVRY